MGKYDEVRKRMGVQPAGTSASLPAPSKYDEARNRMQSTAVNPVATQAYTREELAPYRTIPPEQTTISPAGQRIQEQREIRAGRATTPSASGQRLIDMPANVVEGFGDSIGFGLPQEIMRRINSILVGQGKMTQQEANQYETNRKQRADTTAFKVGQVAGYIPPGAAIERGVASAVRPAIQNLPQWGRLATTGAAAGVIESAAQEGADVAFRQGEFDPLNVALGGAAGGAIGAATPLVGSGLQRLMKGARQQQVAPQGPLREAADRLRPQETLVQQPKSDMGTNAAPSPYKLSGLGITPGQKKQLSDPTMGQIVSGTKKPKTSLAAKADQSYINLVDDIFALKRFDEVAEQAKGRELLPTESTYQLAMASRGADQISKQSLTNKLVNINGDVVGNSLKDALTGVSREQMRNLESYLVNKHAITRFGRGERVFDKLADGTEWTPEKGKEIIDFYNNRLPNLQKAEAGYRQFNDNFNQTWLVDTGMLPKEVIDAWKRDNPTYIDNKRQFSELEKIGGNLGARAKSGFGGQKSPVKGYSKTGSKRKIISPMESMIKRYDATIKAAKRNAPMQAMVRNIQENPEAFKELAEIVPDAPFNLKNIDVSTPEGLEEMLARFDESFESVKNSTRKDLDNVVPVMVNGKPVYVKIQNRQLLDAVLNTNPQIVKGISGIAAKVANFQKNIYTGVNPLFTFARSIFRDPISAYVNSKTTNNPLVFLGDLAHATKQVLTNGQLYQEFKNIGGGYTSPLAANDNLLNRTKRELIPNESKLNGIAMRGWDGFMNFLDKVETAPRLAEFKRSKGTGSTVDDRLRGLAESQDVAINFKRRGAKTKELEGFWIYLNSAVQSLDKTLRAFKDQKIATPAKIALSITTPAMLLYAYNRNDPNYQKLRESEKDRFLHIPIGGGRFARYPIPPELAPFANVPRRLLDQAFGNNEEAWNDFGRTLLETVVPPGVSGIVAGGVDEGIPGAAVGSIRGVPIIGPSVEAWANKSWLNSPIVPGYLQDQSPRYQSNEDTSQIAQFVSRISPNTSPMKTDYMIRNIGGDYGKALTGGLNTQGVISRFVVDSAKSNKLIDDFYKLKEEYDQAYADREIAQLPAWYNDNVRKALGKVSRDMSTINTAIREIKNTDMPKAEKDRQIEALQQQRMQMAQQVTEEVKGMR